MTLPRGSSPPRVFVSHGSEDKDRFVIPFATDLRANGVDAWVDKWEMLPGDSLVRKIFEEGLENADAVIVVLSRTSVSKPWVREELDSAVVKRINTGSRLIPIVLDNLNALTEVPTTIRHLKLEYVHDTQDRGPALDVVLRAVFGEPSAPPIGPPPTYANQAAARIGSLDSVESLVLREAGVEAIRDDGDRFRTAEFVETTVATLELTHEQVFEALDVLTAERLVNLEHRLGGNRAPTFDLTSSGLRAYLRAYEPKWSDWEPAVRARLSEWSEDVGTLRDLAAAADAPMIVTRLVVERISRKVLKFDRRGAGPDGGHFLVVSRAALRRLGPT